ncbi:MAG: porin family protein [Chromatiales bacterium]|nr:porin family protein [Chromatiales bacterium]
MRKLLCVGALAAGMAPIGALYAIEPGPYLGFGIGATSYDLGVSDYDDGNVTRGSVDTSGTGYKLYGGYRFTPNIGLEAYYANLGNTTFNGVANGTTKKHWNFGDISSKSSVDGFGAAMVGTFPVNRDFNVHGKFGLYSWDFDSRETDSGGSFRDSDSGTGLMYGLGVSYQFNFQTALQLEWERYTDVPSFDVNFFSLGLSFLLY